MSQTLKLMCDNTMISNLSNEFCEEKDIEYSKYSSFKVYSDKEDFNASYIVLMMKATSMMEICTFFKKQPTFDQI